MKPLTATSLRQNLFKIIDRVINTGIPVEVEKNGHKLKIVLDEKKKKLDNLKPHSSIVGDPDELVNIKVDQWDKEKMV